MKVRQGGIGPGSWIGWSLEAIGLGVLVPQAGAENSIFVGLGHRNDVAIFAITVQLVDGTGRSDRRAVVILLVVVTVAIDLVVDCPAMTEIGRQADIIEVR